MLWSDVRGVAQGLAVLRVRGGHRFTVDAATDNELSKLPSGVKIGA